MPLHFSGDGGYVRKNCLRLMIRFASVHKAGIWIMQDLYSCLAQNSTDLALARPILIHSSARLPRDRCPTFNGYLPSEMPTTWCHSSARELWSKTDRRRRKLSSGAWRWQASSMSADISTFKAHNYNTGVIEKKRQQVQRQGNWGVLAAGGARLLINSLSAFVQTLLLGSSDQQCTDL